MTRNQISLAMIFIGAMLMYYAAHTKHSEKIEIVTFTNIIYESAYIGYMCGRSGMTSNEMYILFQTNLDYNLRNVK